LNNPETILFWVSALLLAAGLFLALWTLVFGREKLMRPAEMLVLAATLTLTVFGVLRWSRTGHPPFVSLFESMISSIWFLLVIYRILRLRAPWTGVLLAPVSGIALLLIGWSSSVPQEATPLSAALQNVWLFIHASFATAGAATFLAGSALAVIYLLGPERLQRLSRSMGGLPRYESLPGTMSTFLLFGLLLWGVMIVSGSIWAHVAWGRYWGWDPVEVWSLLSWLLFGLLFHARRSLKLSARLFSALAIFATGTVVFSLWGIQYVYQTLHSYG
jgi:cytochrome c-type biogenesis protein CcsB